MCGPTQSQKATSTTQSRKLLYEGAKVKSFGTVTERRHFTKDGYSLKYSFSINQELVTIEEARLLALEIIEHIENWETRILHKKHEDKHKMLFCTKFCYGHC